MRQVPPSFTAEELLAHGDFLRALARRLLLDASRADDVVQQAWLAALKSPPHDPRRLRPWLAAVVKNFARRSNRDAARRRSHEESAPPPEPVPSAEEILAREKARQRVVAAVLALEEPYRSAVVLRYLEELPPRAVARRLRVPVETVRTRLKRGLARLREQLDAESGGDRRAWSLALIPLALPKASAWATFIHTGALLMSTKSKLVAATAVLVAVLMTLVVAIETRSAREDRSPTRAPQRGEDALVLGSEDGNPLAIGEGTKISAPGQQAATRTGVVGTVRGEGQPLAGAFVFVKGEKTLASTVTGADGSFAFPHTGKLTLGAAHPRYGPTRREVDAKEGEVVDVVLDLPPSAFVDLLVVEAETGAPIPGADVLVLVSGGDRAGVNAAFKNSLTSSEGIIGFLGQLQVYGGFFGLLESFERFGPFDEALYIPPQTTDANGRIRIGGLLAGHLEAVVSHPSYVSTRLDATDVDRGSTIRLEMHKGAWLRVIAPLVDGRPAEGYVCDVVRGGDPSLDKGFSLRSVMVLPALAGRERVDRRGEARVGPLRPGTYTVSVSKYGSFRVRVGDDDWDAPEEAPGQGGGGLSFYSSSTFMDTTLQIQSRSGFLAERRVEVDAAAEMVVDLSGPPAATVQGSLVPAPRGGAWAARLLAEEGETRAEVEVDPEGRFRFNSVPPGPYRVVVVFAGAIRASAECTVKLSDEVVEVRLQVEGAQLSGHVHGPDGRALRGATVFAIPAGTEPLPPRSLLAEFMSLRDSASASDAEGEYRLKDLAAGEYFVYCREKGALARRRVVLAPAEDRRIDFHLDETHLHTVAVKVVDLKGKPVSAAVLPRDALSGILASEETTASVTHVFLLEEGKYVLDAYAEGLAPLWGHVLTVDGPREITLRPEAGATVTLLLEGPQGPLAGRPVELRRADGRALPRLGVLDAVMEPAPWRTDAQGRIVAPRVPSGVYTVHVDGQRVATVEVRGGPVERHIRLP